MRFWGFELVSSDLVCTTNQKVLILSTKQEQPRALQWPAMDLAFNHLGKFLILHMGPSFFPWGVLACKLTSICTKIPYATWLGTIEIILRWFGDLENGIANSKLDVSGLCIRVITNVWTKAKWIWLVHFASNLCHFSLPCTWLSEKRTRSKGCVVSKWKCAKVVVMTWF